MLNLHESSNKSNNSSNLRKSNFTQTFKAQEAQRIKAHACSWQGEGK